MVLATTEWRRPGPRRRRGTGAAAARRGAGHRRHPGPRLLPVAARSGPRGGPGHRGRRSPIRWRSPRRLRWSGRLPGALGGRGLPALRRGLGDRCRPDPAESALVGATGAAGRDALDLADRRHHQLRDAGDRAADPRVRRGPAGRADRGPSGTGGGEADHPRRRGPRPERRRPADHRRFRSDRTGRGDGRGQHRDRRGHHLGRGVEAAHFDAMTIARTSRRHKLSSEACRRFERGVDPAAAYAAAHRVAELLVELAGGTAGRARDRRRRGARQPSPPRSTPTCRAASSAPPSIPTTVVSTAGGGRRRRGGRRHGADRHPAELAPGPDRPVRLRRGGRPTGRLRHHHRRSCRGRRSAAG